MILLEHSLIMRIFRACCTVFVCVTACCTLCYMKRCMHAVHLLCTVLYACCIQCCTHCYTLVVHSGVCLLYTASGRTATADTTAAE